MFTLSGCKGLYTAEGIPEAPLADPIEDVEIIILGDSFWDFGLPFGAIPLELIRHSIKEAYDSGVPGALGKTYYDLSVYSAPADYILDIKIPQIPNYGNVETPPKVRTVLSNGGANDVALTCRPIIETGAGETALGDNITTLTPTCEEGLAAASVASFNIMQRLAEIESVEKIVWLGPHYYDNDMIDASILDMVVDMLQDNCDQFNPPIIAGIRFPVALRTCVFIDVRDAWTPDEANEYLFDKIHVTSAGAKIMGDMIWSVLTTTNGFGGFAIYH